MLSNTVNFSANWIALRLSTTVCYAMAYVLCVDFITRKPMSNPYNTFCHHSCKTLLGFEVISIASWNKSKMHPADHAWVGDYTLSAVVKSRTLRNDLQNHRKTPHSCSSAPLTQPMVILGLPFYNLAAFS